MSDQAQTAPAQAKPAFVLAPLSVDTVEDAARSIVAGVVKCEGAKVTLLETIKDAAEDISVALTAAQYDKQVRPYLVKHFAAKVKAGKINEKTAGQYDSKLKTCVLALLCQVAEPLAGEGFFAFYDRASGLLADAKLPGTEIRVWEAAKAGRPAGKGKASAPKGGAVPGVIAQANATGSAAEEGFARSPKVAAALILANQNEARAKRLVAVLETHAEQFDRWAAALLEEKSPKAPPAPVVLKDGEPATAMAAALVKGQAKVNQKAQAKAA